MRWKDVLLIMALQTLLLFGVEYVRYEMLHSLKLEILERIVTIETHIGMR